MARFYTSNKDLVVGLIAEGVLKTPAVISAFYAIDRRDFVPAALRDQAYFDTPLPIGCGQTISQPYTVAFMLELLAPQPGDKILEIGSGSGWQTALIAHAVSDSKSKIKDQKSKMHGSKVFAVERISELYDLGRANVAQYNFVDKDIVEFSCRDGTKGLPEYAPFDKIIAAAAGRAIPEAWREQLRRGGRLVAPVKNSIVRLDKTTVGTWREEFYEGFVFVPLIAE